MLVFYYCCFIGFPVGLFFDLDKLNLGVYLIDISEAYTQKYTQNYYFSCREHRIFERSKGVRDIFAKCYLRILDLRAFPVA